MTRPTQHSPLPLLRRLAPTALLVCALVMTLPGPTASAEEDAVGPDLRVPAASGLLLDGLLDEKAWTEAANLAARPITLPFPPKDPAAREPDLHEMTPEVRVLVAENALWIGVRLRESPGLGIGVAGMLAPAGTASAAEAVAFHYLPQHVGAPRYVVRGPRGVGRATYRLQGAVALLWHDAWSVEVRLPLADLDLERPDDAPLRLAVAVRTREPGLVTFAPPGAAFRGPATWASLLPPEGGWPTGEVTIREDLAVEDVKDEDRLAMWRLYLAASQRSVEQMVQEAGHAGVLEGDLTRAQLLDAVGKPLLAPLDEIVKIRPDLAFAHVLRGDVLGMLGLRERAVGAYRQALDVTRGLREAEVGVWVWGFGAAFAEGPTGGPTDHEARRGELETARRLDLNAWGRDGIRFGDGLLKYLGGDLDEAAALLEPLAGRYPFSQRIVYAWEWARDAAEAWGKERQYRASDEKADDLPRVRLTTSRGDVVLELFEDDAPNTVRNFVWLVEHDFYDGTRVSSTVPLFRALLGDARTRAGADAERSPGPGYAIQTEKPARRDGRVRLPFRGTALMAAGLPDSEGSRFFLTTGTAFHLGTDFVAFGRVLEGQDVLESLRADDEVREAVVLRRRPGVEYRPLTVEGEPAPPPE